MGRAICLALGCGLAVSVLLGGLRLWAERRARERMFVHLQDVPARPVAIILGAGLWSDGSPTPILADRIVTGVDLYHAGVVQKLLLSGDVRSQLYDEPQRMREVALRLGVPEEDIVLDRAGRRTYDTCYRARAVFGVEEAVVVTQRFHAARTLYLCDALGVDAVAALADRQDYTLRRVTWETREYLALALAWWDVNVRRPTPLLDRPSPTQ